MIEMQMCVFIFSCNLLSKNLVVDY